MKIKAIIYFLMFIVLGMWMLNFNVYAESDSEDGEEVEIKEMAVYLTTESIFDGRVNDIYAGLTQAGAEQFWDVTYIDEIREDDMEDTISKFCEMGFSLIFLSGNKYNDLVIKLGEKYPLTYFCLLNGTACGYNYFSIISAPPLYSARYTGYEVIGFDKAVISKSLNKKKEREFRSFMAINDNRYSLENNTVYYNDYLNSYVFISSQSDFYKMISRALRLFDKGKFSYFIAVV
ncbi:Basic membrane protein [Acetitomaculum ruminis DSM 5522]|uniref:Basic membrane protein n=1 Tax=Acetitomaculum ruminis DSM 5522 TaxID=1120918 RepID=A0A1I0UYM4_9FIRM|nr:BMP family ABC transporter substrate-binding protein [Acetitomaculum ruminis]SFA68960.1 Basic membrane protein [Acetitomaculum ruminis DSM 5522]